MFSAITAEPSQWHPSYKQYDLYVDRGYSDDMIERATAFGRLLATEAGVEFYLTDSDIVRINYKKRWWDEIPSMQEPCSQEIRGATSVIDHTEHPDKDNTRQQMETWLSPQEWLDPLDMASRAKADHLIGILESRGAADPVGWVSSEAREGIPQVARFLFLHEVRGLLIDPLQSASGNEIRVSPRVIEACGGEAFDRLVAAGVDRGDLERIMRGAAYSAIEEFLGFLDGVYGSETEDDEDAPRWMLAEVVGSSDASKFTGRCLDGLHESSSDLYTTDS